MHTLRVEQLRGKALGPIDLTVNAQQTLCLHGASGSGKSLLLRAIADLDPNQGEVHLGQHARTTTTPHQWRSWVRYIPPETHWWCDSVGAHTTRWDEQLLLQLGFDIDVLEWQITRLSSGEKQRLMLALSLSSQPRALLLDEPTANLDADNTEKVERLIHSYQAQHQAPIIWVSHDPAQRHRVADQSIEMSRGQLAA